VIQTVVTLAGVVALAILVLYAARRAGVGRASGPLSVVGRLPLDGRRAVYLVRVGRAIYVLGVSDGGLVKLGEMSEADLVDGGPQVKSSA
jgi:flagellar biogenesis protein FliO